MPRVCPKCGVEKALSEFPPCPRYKDNLYWCRSCFAYKARYWRKRNPIKAREKYYRAYCKCQTSKQELGRLGHQQRKIRVLTHYSGGKCACVLCGFDNLKALSIDHINGGGLKHRRELGIDSGSNFYVWLEKENLPEGFRTLCMNCQYIEHNKRMEEKYVAKKKSDGAGTRGIC